MYLERMPRYKNVTANQIDGIAKYFSIERAKQENPEYANFTLEQWCGFDEKDLPDRETIEFLRQFNKHDEYFLDHITDEIGYWRKANAIHNWFVEHVQNGIDDCKYHNEVTKEILEELLDTCMTVLKNSELFDAPVVSSFIYCNGRQKPEFIDGKIVKDPSVAMQLLPTQEGFFFGSTDYDQWYIEYIENTIDIINKVLRTTDFEREMIYYISSW